VYTINKNNGGEIKVFTDNVEYDSINQIKELGNFEAYENERIRIMPDCHYGNGCTIGTTMTISDKVTPNLVGVDIGCGMLTVELDDNSIVDLLHLDKVIREFIPNGKNVHESPVVRFNFDRLKVTRDDVNMVRGGKALGSLGGGNHFIEIAKGHDDKLYLIIHSGSRNIGLQIAKHYQNIAWKNVNEMKTVKENIVKKLKAEGRESEIASELKKAQKPSANKALAYLEGDDFDDYMNDMKVMQDYAAKNRETMAAIILQKMGLRGKESFQTVHNYIDFNRMILRKGAVSAEKDEVLLIPMNMRDGSLLCVGKGNMDWNYSAPHGAGRLMSRTKAKAQLNMKDFKEQMEDVYTTSVCKATLDEAPDAYKPMQEIIDNIGDTVRVIDILKPIYNFKAND